MTNHNGHLASESLQKILSKLDKVKYIGSSKYMARCPAHQDKDPSLSVADGDDGRVLIKCHAGCTPEDIVARLGLTMADLFREKKGVYLQTFLDTFA
jgi:hypothetical protein